MTQPTTTETATCRCGAPLHKRTQRHLIGHDFEAAPKPCPDCGTRLAPDVFHDLETCRNFAKRTAAEVIAAAIVAQDINANAVDGRVLIDGPDDLVYDFGPTVAGGWETPAAGAWAGLVVDGGDAADVATSMIYAVANAAIEAEDAGRA